MAMTKTERKTIENIIKRLNEPRVGCAEPFPSAEAKSERQAPGYEGVSRIYIDTWLIGPLKLLLDGDARLACNMSSRQVDAER